MLPNLSKNATSHDLSQTHKSANLKPWWLWYVVLEKYASLTFQ